MKYLYFFFSVIFLKTALFSSGEKVFLHTNLEPFNAGMFSVFTYVTGVLYEYESNDYAGIHVDFEERGCYYTPEYGPNWWEYYCRPICLGTSEGAETKRYSGYDYAMFTRFVERDLSREQVHSLIEKYIHIRDEILEKVDEFIQNYFNDSYVIGVHYRGTDKGDDSPILSYSEVCKHIREHICSNSLEGSKIFLATDESQFFDYMRREFGELVIAYSTQYSEDGSPLHQNSPNPFLHGEEALIDSLLLSRTDLLIRTSSNLSLWSTYFNPQLPVIQLSRRYDQ